MIGTSKMKKIKIVSVLLMLSFLLNVFSLSSFSSEVISTSDELNAYEFSSLMQKLVRAYIPDSFASVEELDEFPTNRLIVRTKSNEPLENDYGAADKIEGYDCLHIFTI